MKEIIISVDKEQNKIIMLLENGILIEKYEQTTEYKHIEGNIYIGKVQNIFQGMQAAFINIGEEKNTFIHLKDIMPKINTRNIVDVDEEKHENIKDYIKTNDTMLVQVKRSSSSTKGARVSTHINITGKYIVLLPNTDIVTVSQKIENGEEKEKIVKFVEENLPANCGAIVRTSAFGKPKNKIKKEIENLHNTWLQIEKKAMGNIEAPVLLYENNDIIKTMLIDMIDKNIEKIIINDKNGIQEIKEQIEEIGDITNIEIDHRENEEVMNIYDVGEQIEKLKNRKIHLNCGGFITIDRTEALTAIDVNTGKYTGKKDLEQTIFMVNKEATLEIAKQVRLRDIGGIVIIDYIDMKDVKNREQIINILEQELKKDRSKTQILGFTKLNLLEMTRKKIQ